MSVVTDIILVTSLGDGATRDNHQPNADYLSGYLQREHRGQRLIKVNEYAGGSKAMQCDVFIAAINVLDLDEFLRCFYPIDWEYAESVQLMIKCEDCDRFEVFTPKP